MATIHGTSGSNNLVGTSVNDQIYGYAGNDTLKGELGNDYLEGGSGNDSLIGGSGRDTFVLDCSGGGIDIIRDFSVNGDILKINTPVISSTSAISQGSTGDDTLIGKSGEDSLAGGVDNDILTGGKDSNSLPSIKSTENPIQSTNSTTDVLTSTKVSTSEDIRLAAPIVSSEIVIIGGGVGLPSYCSYNANTGALFYLDQQLAWLPPNLSFPNNA
ncbi:MAG TPA: hypothetical protein VE944_19740 [Nostoc sp.]|uniref:hypothetical protein n=1 Tax=Nostoc sp. TaxID=1180 RepID=UPI002D3C2AD5|nr:hypothetical protein [Nostoc sp.]HYX16553.1 hypothetical protein [Nostoc sp.]